MTKQQDVVDNENYIKVFDHGFVGLVESMGDISSIARAARTSYGKGTKTINDDISLVDYLIRHKHTSPLEMVEFIFHIKMPIFVARQWIRHRTASLNEYSARYSEMTDEFYVPEPDAIKKQSKSNNQGREGEIADSQKDFYRDILGLSAQNSYASYKKVLDNDGLSRELARIVLPVSNYTEMYWKMDLNNLFHFLKLRMDSHAQYEIQEYAKCIYNLIKKDHPELIEMFDDHMLYSVTFSKTEMDILKEILDKTDEEYISNIKHIIIASLGKRKATEFFNKININD